MVTRLDTTATLALETQSLEQLRAQARQSPDQALKAAAQQFESVFLNMMLKSMREATPQDGMFDSEQTRMFTGMLDQQLAQSMASRGVGLADIMVRQLRGQMTEDTGQKAENLPLGLDLSLRAPRSPLLDPQPLVSALPSAHTGTVQENFISRMLPFASQASQASGVPPQLMLGQAALESGWGRREIRMADGSNSFNLFGIKAGGSWNGKVADVMTTEYKDGIAHRQVEKFRAYPSYAEAFRDYATMISSNPRYAGVLQQGNDVAGLTQAMQKAGYATDPNYADKLARVMGMLKIET